MLKKTLDYSINLILAVLLSFSFAHALFATLEFIISPVIVFLLVLLFLLACSLFFMNKLTTVIFGTAAGIIVVSSLSYLLYKDMFLEFTYGIYLQIEWFIDYIYMLEPYKEEPAFYITIYICILITLPVFFTAIKKFNFYFLLAGGAILFVAQWTCGFFASYTAFYVFIFVILMYYLKHIYLKNQFTSPGDYITSGMFNLFIMPFCIIVTALSLCFPVKSTPIEWKWLDTKISNVYNYLTNRYDYQVFDYFSVASTGFGVSNNRLGGKVHLDKTIVLMVESPRRVYLKGAVRDTYTGFSWINGSNDLTPVTDKKKALEFDTFELVQAFSLLSNNTDSFDKYFIKDTIKITFYNLKTKSIFYPVKLDSINPGSIDLSNMLVNEDGNLSSGKMLAKGYKYEIEALNGMYGNKEFIDALRKSSSELYNDTLESLDTSFDSNTDEDDQIDEEAEAIKDTLAFLDVFIPEGTHVSEKLQDSEDESLTPDRESLKAIMENTNTIYEKYTRLPDSFPERVKDFTISIVSGKDNNYDKVKAIESYLSNNYPYTLSPRPTPKDRDFADYFLFDLKEGYCTYFATAMTVMVRSLGIPARYVEGYMLPSEPGSKNIYYVTNEQAHAWVEVYFEGLGWLPFEPTSPFRNVFYTDNTYYGNFSSDFYGDPEYEDYMEMMRGYGHTGYILSDLEGSYMDDKTKALWTVLILVSMLGLILLSFITVTFFNSLKQKLMIRRFLKMPPRKSVLSFYNYFIKVLKIQRLPIEPGETPTQYAGRIDRFLFFKSYSFEAVTKIFMLARYSLKEISEEQKKVLYGFYEPFTAESRNNMGKLKFWLYRHLLGKL